METGYYTFVSSSVFEIGCVSRVKTRFKQPFVVLRVTFRGPVLSEHTGEYSVVEIVFCSLCRVASSMAFRVHSFPSLVMPVS